MSFPSNFGFQFSLWWTSHRPWFRFALLSIFLIVNAIVWGSFFISGLGYIQQRREQPLQMQQSLETQVQLNNVHLAIAPDPLLLKKTGALNVGGGRSDVYAVLENPNAYWAAKSLTFQFNGRSEPRTSFLLPSEQKTVMDFLIEGLTGGNPTVTISNIDWVRIQGETLPQANFNVSNAELSAVVSEKEGTRTRSTLLRFELGNRSPHHFFSVQAKTLLKQGGVIVAINAVTLPKMLSQSSETVAMSWPAALPLNSEIEIIPEVNVLDKGSLLVLPEAPKRTE